MFAACFNMVLIKFSVCTQRKTVSTYTLSCTVLYIFEVCDKSFKIKDEYLVTGILIVEGKKIQFGKSVLLLGNLYHHQTFSFNFANKTNS